MNSKKKRLLMSFDMGKNMKSGGQTVHCRLDICKVN